MDPTQQNKIEKSHSSAVYVKSEKVDPNTAMKVEGYDFNKGLDYEAVFKSYISTGFQATSLG
jgi:deoxyhypusine synthase